MDEDRTLLARRYRRLLSSYPRGYRRVRGEELLHTLLDLAAPGQTRPTLRESVDLVRHGLRCRLGRPKSRTVVVWAALVALIWGLFSAAVATRAAWETARPLPAPAEARALFVDVFPGHALGSIQPAKALFVFYGQPVSWSDLPAILLPDGGEYQQGVVATVANGVPPVAPAEIVTRTRERLEERGWTVTDPIVSNAAECAAAPCNPMTLPKMIRFAASRGDTVLAVEVIEGSTVNTTYLSVELSRKAPAAIHPAGAIAGLLGAALTWLLFGWASRRTEGRAGVTGLFAFAMTLWWAPVLLVAPGLATHHLREPHPSWHPLWEWLGQPAGSFLFVPGCVCGLLALVRAAFVRRQATPDDLSSGSVARAGGAP